MKKVLEGALLSIAHRILQMKDKEDVTSLYKEAKEVYEKLAVLKFYHDNKPSLEGIVSEQTLEKQLAIVSDSQTHTSPSLDQDIPREQMPVDLVIESEPVSKSDLKTIQEPQGTAYMPLVDTSVTSPVHIIDSDVLKVESSFEEPLQSKQEVTYENQYIHTAFNDSIEEDESDELLHNYLDQHEAMLKQKQVLNTSKAVNATDQISEKEFQQQIPVDTEIQEAMIHPESAGLQKGQVRLEDSFLGFDFSEVDFVRVDKTTSDASSSNTSQPEETIFAKIQTEHTIPTPSLFELDPVSVPAVSKKSINDSYNSTIAFGLNDRIGFEKHLFNGSSEDLNRVLSQLNTVNSYQEAVRFIDDLVKPDYNNWEGKESYVERFMELVEKRFV